MPVPNIPKCDLNGGKHHTSNLHKEKDKQKRLKNECCQKIVLESWAGKKCKTIIVV